MRRHHSCSCRLRSFGYSPDSSVQNVGWSSCLVPRLRSIREGRWNSKAVAPSFRCAYHSSGKRYHAVRSQAHVERSSVGGRHPEERSPGARCSRVGRCNSARRCAPCWPKADAARTASAWSDRQSASFRSTHPISSRHDFRNLSHSADGVPIARRKRLDSIVRILHFPGCGIPCFRDWFRSPAGRPSAARMHAAERPRRG
jgi:hypothetical protein